MVDLGPVNLGPETSLQSPVQVDARAGTAFQSAAAHADAQLGARAASSPSAIRCAVQQPERPRLAGKPRALFCKASSSDTVDSAAAKLRV